MRRIVLCLLAALALPAGRLAAATVTIEPSADTTIFEENPDASDALGPGIFTGRNALTFRRRALVRFDIANAVPAGSTINGARLEMTVTRSQGNPVDVLLFRMTAPWGEGTSDAGVPGGTGTGATPGDATWTMGAWPSMPWTDPGGDTFAAPSATATIATTLGLYAWGPNLSMVSDVQDWLDNPASNFGWQVRADELQAPPSARRWGSRQNPVAADRPHLQLTFNPPGVSSRPANDVPALSPPALAGLAAALAVLGALALRR